MSTRNAPKTTIKYSNQPTSVDSLIIIIVIVVVVVVY